jgi:hypothetical protein
MTEVYDEIGWELSEHGLALRGGFAVGAADGVPDFAPGRPALTVLMIGNTGQPMWEAFQRANVTGANPLDRWSKSVIAPIAARHGARVVYPYDAPPWPFQRWAQRAWPLFSSPLGLLVDTEFGLWHALRGALLFDVALDLPVQAPRVSPCESCADKPCLTACPVDAFTADGFDYRGCRSYLATPAGAACNAHGCRARVECPVGQRHRYAEGQLQFHMRAFRG